MYNTTLVSCPTLKNFSHEINGNVNESGFLTAYNEMCQHLVIQFGYKLFPNESCRSFQKTIYG